MVRKWLGYLGWGRGGPPHPKEKGDGDTDFGVSGSLPDGNMMVEKGKKITTLPPPKSI